MVGWFTTRVPEEKELIPRNKSSGTRLGLEPRSLRSTKFNPGVRALIAAMILVFETDFNWSLVMVFTAPV